MDEDQLKLDAFKKAALTQGYDPNEVEAFASMAQVAQKTKKTTEKSTVDDYVGAVQGGMPFDSVPDTYKAKVFNQLKSSEDYLTTGQPSSANITSPTFFETPTEKKERITAEAQAKGYAAIQKPTQEQWDKLEPITQSLLIDKGIKPPAQDEADKNKSKILDVASELLTRDTQRITGMYGKVPILPGESAQYTKALYNQLKGSLSLENRKLLKGSGTISDYEMKILEDAATALNSNLSDKDFKDVLTKLVIEFGGKLPELSSDQVVGRLPEKPQKQLTVDDIVGKAKNVIAPGLGPIGEVTLGEGRGVPPGMTNLIKETTTGIGKQMTGEEPMKTLTIKDVLTSAGGPLAEILLNSNSDMVKKSLPASAEVLSIILVPELFKWGVGKLKTVVDTKTVNAIRTAKAQSYTVKVPTTPIQEAMEKYVKDVVRPSDLEESQKLLKVTKDMFTNKKMTVEQLLNKAVEANKAFTKGGTIRSAAADNYDAQMGRAIKEIIKKVAPDVAKLTDQLHMLYQVPKAIKTASYYAGLPIALGYGLSQIGRGLKSLGGKQ